MTALNHPMYRTLSISDMDRFDILAGHVRAVLAVIGAASEVDSLPDTAIRGACWGTAELLRLMVDRIHGTDQPGVGFGPPSKDADHATPRP